MNHDTEETSNPLVFAINMLLDQLMSGNLDIAEEVADHIGEIAEEFYETIQKRFPLDGSVAGARRFTIATGLVLATGLERWLLTNTKSVSGEDQIPKCALCEQPVTTGMQNKEGIICHIECFEKKGA